MAVPLLWRLPASARIAYPFILAGTRRGLSSRAIEQSVREAGLRISRTRTILPLMRAIREAEAAGRNVRFIPKGNAVNVNRLPEAITHIRREFSYSVRVRGLDGSGAPIERFIQVTTDNPLMTVQEIEDNARAAAEGELESGGLADVEVQIDEGLRRADFL